MFINESQRMSSVTCSESEHIIQDTPLSHLSFGGAQSERLLVSSVIPFQQRSRPHSVMFTSLVSTETQPVRLLVALSLTVLSYSRSNSSS